MDKEGILTDWHLKNWPDQAFKEHIPAVRKSLSVLWEEVKSLQNNLAYCQSGYEVVSRELQKVLDEEWLEKVE